MHRWFITVLRSVLLLVLLTDMVRQPQPAQAASVIQNIEGISATLKEAFSGASDKLLVSNMSALVGSEAFSASNPNGSKFLMDAAPGPAPAKGGFTISSMDKLSSGNSALKIAQELKLLGYTLPSYAPSRTVGGLTITPITAYNLIVDSNVLSPSSYGPSAATLGAQYCNTSSATMTNVWAYTGNFNGDNDTALDEAGDYQAGVYPVRDENAGSYDPAAFATAYGATTTNPLVGKTSSDYGASNTFALKFEGGSLGTSDASRYIGTLAAGECRTEYWLVSYPRKARTNTSTSDWVTVTGGVKPEDDLWLPYFFWGTSSTTGATPSYIWRPVTMRNEISAMANKIWPNGDNKVPPEYIAAIQQVTGWSTWTPSGSGVAYPGQVATSQGIWYDFGVVGAGFDNNGDFAPDRNAWVQPVGDAGTYDAGCFRLIKTYGLVIVKLNDGTEMLIPFVDRMYFENVPDNNTGAVGLVYYQYAALDGACTAGLTPYQEVASGYDNEKFNGDFGAGVPPMQSQETNMTVDKTGPASVASSSTVNYTVQFALPESSSTTLYLSVGDPSTSMPLVFEETIPAGMAFISPVSPLVTMTNYSPAALTASLLYSTNSGATWSASAPANGTLSSAPNNLIKIQWWLPQAIQQKTQGGGTVYGSVSFSATSPTAVNPPPMVTNTACLKMGNGPSFTCDDATTLITGAFSISGTVFCDDGAQTSSSGPCSAGAAAGTLANGSLDAGGGEPGMPNVSVYLYYDSNGNGTLDATDTLVNSSTVTNASGLYTFSNLGPGTYFTQAIKTDGDIQTTYGLTTPESRIATIVAANVTGLDYGFAPPLSIEKSVDRTTGIGGSTFTYTITLNNNLPGSGQPGNACVYRVWAGQFNQNGGTPPGGGPANAQWQNAGNSTGRPDGQYTYTVMADTSDELGLTRFNTADMGGNITSVGYRIVVNELLAFDDDSMIVDIYDTATIRETDTYTVVGSGTGIETFTGPTGKQYIIDGAITWVPTGGWKFSDFSSAINRFGMRIVGNRNGGTAGDLALDAASFIITTDQTCSGADSTLDPVPLTDIFRNDHFTLVSTNPPYNSTSVSGTDTTISWNNVGPIYPGGYKQVAVTLRSNDIATTSLDTATSANSKFANGTSANSPVSDTVTVTITDNTDPRSLAGRVFDDNGTSGWTGTAWAVPGGNTGVDGADVGIQGALVTLYQCVLTATGVPVTNAGANRTCAEESGEWRPAQTVYTNANGDYSFPNLVSGYYYVQVAASTVAGSQTADVNQTGVCTTCDSRSNDPNNTSTEELEDPAFVGDLDDNTALTTINFGYNIPSGTFDLGDTLYYDWDGDGVQDANEEGVSGVTVQLLRPDGSVAATQTTSATGGYLFTSLPAAVYTVRVVDSSLPGYVTQTGDPDQPATTCSVCDNASTVSLTATNLTRDFGYKPYGSVVLGDTVFRDMDGSGVQSGVRETGIPNITINLLVDMDGNGTWVTAKTTTTNSSGKYQFTNLPDGAYRIRVDTVDTDLPTDSFGANYIPTNGSLYTAITVSGGVIMSMTNPTSGITSATANGFGDAVENDPLNLDADFGFAPLASIGDTVYWDSNANGTQDFTEPGINGVTVRLYTFTDLPDGRYTAGESFTDTNGNGRWDSGEPFVDTLGNGRYDPGETLSGSPAATTVTTTINNQDGKYFFSGLDADKNGVGYVIIVDTSSAPIASSRLNADPNSDGVPTNCAAINPSDPYCDARDGMKLYPGSNYTGADFGFLPLGAFGDTLWIDTNNDGIVNNGETGIPNITITAFTNNNVTVNGVNYPSGTTLTTSTDANGNYTFQNITAIGSLATWTVIVDTSDSDFPAGLIPTYDPDGTLSNSTTVVVEITGVVTGVGGCFTLPNGCDGDTDALNLDADFGYRYDGSGALSGTICLDSGYTSAAANTATDNVGVCGVDRADTSGIGTGEAAYDNVTVYLYRWIDGDGDSVIDSGETLQIAVTATDANGDYSFTNIPDTSGAYYLVSIGAPQSEMELTTQTGDSLTVGDTAQERVVESNPTVGGVDYADVSAYEVVFVPAGSAVTNVDFAFAPMGNFDYGDLPSTYSTLLNDSPVGPSHTVPATPTLYLGATPPDSETNGAPTADATGDGADEDGVSLVGVWGNGAYNAVNETGGAVSVTVNGSGVLIGWIDFNRDGDFTDSGEMIIHQSVTAGTASYTFNIPADTFAGPSDPADLTLYARFRLFESEPLFPSLAYMGSASNGEVEDYAFHWAMTVDKDTTTPNVSPTGTVTYTVALVNTGNATLTNLQATDILPDFNGAAAGKGYTVTTVTATGGLTVNFPGFDGETNTDLLAAGNSLVAGASRTITITLTLSDAVAATYDNTVSVSSTQTGTLDDDGTAAQDPGTPSGSDPESDEDVTAGSTGSLVIVKNTIPDDAQDFAYTVSGTGLTPFTLDDDADATLSNTQTFNSLAAGGTYTVTEMAVTGWSVTNISCTGATGSTITIGAAGGFDAGDTAVNVLLAGGETVTCTFENTAVLSIVATKTASDTSIPETGQSVTYIVEVENTSPVEVTLDSLTDDIFNDITTTGHDNVTATTCATGGAIAAGATYACAFAANVSGTFPGTHVNTVNAQVSNGSNTTSDADDETVTFEEALPELAVVKSSSAGGTVQAGDTITYTITITNTGNVTQNNIAVSDAQPAGTTYVDASSIATGYMITVPQYYLDRFEIAQFNNSNGSTAWGATPWTETGDDGIANSGKIQINTSTPWVADFQATAPTDVLTLTRPVNLTNAASATLTYSISENGVNSAADTARVQVWNGTAWTTIATYTGDFTSATGNINILAYANAGTQIRFVVTGFDGMTQNLTLDNVRVQHTFASTLAEDNDPFGGVSGSLINGSPPTLLLPDDKFDLLPGQSMTVSYRATVNNPVPVGQTQVVNIASVTSDEIVTPVQATVTDDIQTTTGSLTIIKDSMPDNAQDFAFTVNPTPPLNAFTLDDDSDGTLPNTRTFTGLAPADYTVTETSAAGWALTNITCSAPVMIGTDADFDPGDTNVNINLAAGQNITCTFTNTRLITLTLQKTWVNAILNNAAVVTARVGGVPIDWLSSVANTANETDTDPTPVTVSAGQNITFTETFNTGTATTYVSWMSCTGATDTDLSDGLTVNASDTAIVCTETNASFSPGKFWVATSEDSWYGPEVVVGEIVRYRLYVRLPEGTTTNLRFLDHLADNLAFMNDGATKVAFVCNSGPACISSSNPALGTSPIISGNTSTVTPTFVLPATNISGGSGHPYGDGVDPTFHLGTLTNSDSDADGEYVVIQFNALVLNTAANVDGATRANTFDVLVEGATVVTSGSQTITILEPALTISKAVTTMPTDAGDPIVYELVVNNTGTAPAFDIAVSDILDAALTAPVDVSGSTMGGPCGSTPSTVSGSFTSPNVSVTVTCLNPGGRATITVSAQVADSAQPGLTFTNSASLTYGSLPGTGTPPGPANPTGSTTPGASGTTTGERDGSGGMLNDYVATSNIVSTTLATPALDKLDPIGTATIGEIITYNLCVTLPEGQTEGLVVSDAVPAGLAVQGYSISAAADGICPVATAAYNGDADSVTVTSAPAAFPGANGADLTLSFATVTTNADGIAGNNTFLVQVTAQVLNVSSNQEAGTLNNTASLTYTDPNDASTDSVTDPSAPSATTIVEPTLSITKSASTLTPAPGPLTFTLTVAHTATSDVPAHDTTITDALPAGLSGLTNVNVSSPFSCATGIVNNSTVTALDVTIGAIPLGCVVTITYDVTVSGVNGDTRTNGVDMSWTSLLGVDAGERTGADGPGGALNDYADTAAVTVTVNLLDNAVISDRIWNDVDGDGVQDMTETGMGAGIRVYLDLDHDNVYDAGEPTDLTDASGMYAITDLAAGTYDVRVDNPPAGYRQTYDLDGTGTSNEASLTLAAGEIRNDVDFGYQQLASIGNFVWYDDDGDGIQDAGEAGIPGITVYVDLDGSGTFNAGDLSGVTDGSGIYSIANIPPGTYDVRVNNPPANANLTGGTNPASTTLTAGEVDNTLDFGYNRLVTIGDYVWDDLSGNGMQDVGEPGLAGVTVRLLDSGGTVVATTTTNASGLYNFTVPAGTYRVDFDLPVGYIFTSVNQGGNYAIDSDADRTTGETANYILAPGETNNTLDAGMVWASAIGDYVWNDLDADGVQDAGESGIDGITVELYRSGDAAPTATQTTAGGGGYLFELLVPGDYYVHFVLPAGYVFATQDAAAATDLTDSDANAGTGNTAVTVLLPGESDNTFDAGMYWPVDLQVMKTDGVATYIPNGSLTYTIRVWNSGPSDAVNASFTDNRPATISSWSWTCAAAGSASCGSTTTGTGNISLNDIDLPADAGGATDYLTFTINATVTAGASGSLTNTATVTAPSGLRETDATNNSASDTDTLANATLTLQKTVVNDNGGTATDADWTLTATGPTTINGTEGQPAVTNIAVLMGTYTLAESGGPGNYTASAWSCAGASDLNPADGLVIAPGEDVTCEITNDDDPPSLTLVKSVTNDNGGTDSASAWTLTADGTGTNDMSGAGPSISSNASLQADTFTLSESGAPAGYTASAWSCTNGITVTGGQITLGLGQSTTCTITNDDDAPSLTLNKIVINDNGGTAAESDWTLTATGPTTLSGAGASGGADVVSGAGFEAGTYILSESGPAGYTASAWTCTNGITIDGASQIVLSIGQTTVCSITNDDTNLLPQADPDTNTAVEGGPAVGGDVLTNETSLGNEPTTVTTASQGASTITIGAPFSTAAGGELTLNADGTYSYTPPPWNLVPPAGVVEVFTYTITDVDGDSSSTTLTINVTNDNRTPIANDDTNTTTENTPVSGDVTPNDVLSGDGGNTWHRLTGPGDGPSNGTVSFNSNGTYTYTPNAGYYGMDSFNYEICDIDGDCDPATVIITVRGNPRGLTKTVVNHNEPSTIPPDVAIGEIVTYEVRIIVPPGTFTNAQLVDTMERGLSYMDCVEITSTDPGLQTSNIDGFTAVCADAVMDNAGGTTTVDVGRRVTFDFGTLTNNTAADQTLVVTYRAVVLDSAQNFSGVNLDNSAEWFWGAADHLGPSSVTVTIAEPDLSIVKTASATSVAVGDEITITLTIRHTANSETDAYDAVVTDVLPAELQYVAGSLECVSGTQSANTCTEAGGTVTASWDNFTLSGGNGRVTFRVTVLSLPAGGIVNTANVAWTSMPGVPPNGPGLPPGQQTVNVLSTERGYDPGDPINVYGTNSVLRLGILGTGGGGGAGDRSSSSAKMLPATGFAPGTVTDLSHITSEAYDATNDMTVEIPSLGIKLPVVGVPLKDGAWNVSWLSKQAGWLEGTAFPSWNGNSVLTSHVYLSNGLPGPFISLRMLKYGDKIIIHAYGQKYIFEVRENLVVEPDDTSILKHEEKPWLTLVTCNQYDEKTNGYRKRVAVRAVLISVAWE